MADNCKITPVPAPKPKDRQYIRPMTKTESALHDASRFVEGMGKAAGGVLGGLLAKKPKK